MPGLNRRLVLPPDGDPVLTSERRKIRSLYDLPSLHPHHTPGAELSSQPHATSTFVPQVDSLLGLNAPKQWAELTRSQARCCPGLKACDSLRVCPRSPFSFATISGPSFSATHVELDVQILTRPRPPLITPAAQVIVTWLPGIACGVAILLVLQRFHHFLVLPGMLFAIPAAFYVLAALEGFSLQAEAESGRCWALVGGLLFANRNVFTREAGVGMWVGIGRHW